jgi:hypothetical protein
MKFVVIFGLLFSQASLALTKQEFLELGDDEKMEFLQGKATEYYMPEDLEKFKTSNPKLMENLKEQGLDLARVWWDTILEGPYALNGEKEVELSSVYMFNNEIYAVGAYVSAPALMIDSCDYNEDEDQWEGEDCYGGTITEGFYIDFNGEFIDSGNYAEFDS